MLRSILAVILSYVLMVILIMASFAALLFGLGPDRLLVPGRWDGNLFFSITVPAITLTVGILGGWLCARIARKTRPVAALAGLVLALGFLSAYFTLQKPAPTGPRAAGMTVQQFMEHGREPAWVALSNPVLGAAGVLVGGLWLRRPTKSPAAASGPRA